MSDNTTYSQIMRQTFVLLPKPHPARDRALNAVRDAPDGYCVTIGESTRTLAQNAKFHELCTDVSKSGAKWAGKTRDAAAWKVLFVSGHSIATGQGAEMVPGLENEFVNLRESTARMSKSRASSLIEYVIAWCAENNVRINLVDTYA